MSQLKYFAQPETSGYAYRGLPEALRATITHKRNANFHVFVKAWTALRGKHMTKLSESEVQHLSSLFGAELLKSKAVPESKFRAGKTVFNNVLDSILT